MPGSRRRKQLYHRKLSLRRKDIRTRFVVDLGILYLPTLGIQKTRELLRSQLVLDSVINRVLHHPKFRRTYTQP